jgi:hypothetical protein
MLIHALLLQGNMISESSNLSSTGFKWISSGSQVYFKFEFLWIVIHSQGSRLGWRVSPHRGGIRDPEMAQTRNRKKPRVPAYRPGAPS